MLRHNRRRGVMIQFACVLRNYELNLNGLVGLWIKLDGLYLMIASAEQ